MIRGNGQERLDRPGSWPYRSGATVLRLMSEDIKEVLVMAAAIVGLLIFTLSAVYLCNAVHDQQRHAFIVKCMADLGDNNIELCSSIAK